MELADGVCSNYRKADRGQDQAVGLFSALNNMQPDEMPPMLPELTQMEEILISRVHVFLEVRLIRGQQYRYQGHVVHFLRDIGLELLNFLMQVVHSGQAGLATRCKS
ncbi:hypothetical protein N7516_002200 [Penicillium verrucosum]|uniref:uncharacterized protein n=1 Tax=Penicillium verrucosum TaxID=60171 RepID=UPI0025453076|nr:uncharacterized protein N7516_002200 [Penicillium verrucosum]KAJ5942032.1 hypothetical protein N7516_002200 [Penicillium verrucosum]